MAAPQEPPKHPLDNLQAMYNLVLITSGRTLKEQRAGASTARLQYNIKRTIPAAVDRFHDSLDELDKDIYHAQLVLRRDLALLQADRQKREQAEAAERQRLLAAESSAKKKSPVKPEAPRPAALPAIPLSLPVPAGNPPPDLESAALAREKEDPPDAHGSTSALPPSAPALLDDDDDDDDDDDTANMHESEFDFEAMFGDDMMDTQMEGDGANAHGDMDMDMAASGPDLNFTLEDPEPSLLRGLEDFAKASDQETSGAGPANAHLDLDFAMADVADVPASQAPEPQASAVEAADPTAQDAADSAMLVDTMGTDNLDDLFNMDYDNPEETQFDDAFFGFGES